MKSTLQKKHVPAKKKKMHEITKSSKKIYLNARSLIKETTFLATTTLRPEPCNPSPCGANAICNERNGATSCTCIKGYFGDPYTSCRPECVINNDCDRSRACLNNKCIDPCPGTCGPNADCRVVNHSPSCSCLPGFSGDPLRSCQLRATTTSPLQICEPTPCGPNSNCRAIDGHAVCSCKLGFMGAPPRCRPECTSNPECPQTRACVNNKCQDPCPGSCGRNAKCTVVNHNPVCSCNNGFRGDPFSACFREEVITTTRRPENPCQPNPCGSNAQCRNIGSSPACSCLPEFIGQPPNCRPECVDHSQCPANRACVNTRCKDPCQGSCAPQATCNVLNHRAVCSCSPGYTGDARVQCDVLRGTYI